ncbi:hypothetical protein JXM67_08995 [candidate division WOR-3 bacterium]|nr:hypothetical protein [candidate division WOR-3 bacterium]
MTEENIKRHRLHWPAWIWVSGHIILGGSTVISLVFALSGGTLGEILFSHNSTLWIVSWALRYSAYMPLCFAAALGMLLNRRIGWWLTWPTLLVSTVYFVIRAIIPYSGTGQLLTDPDDMLVSLGFSIVVITINACWVVYFIIARHRYGLDGKAS